MPTSHDAGLPSAEQQAFHAARETPTQNSGPDRGAEWAQREAAAQARVAAWLRTNKDRSAAEQQRASLRTDNGVWASNPENRDRTFVGSELFETEPIERGPVSVTPPILEITPGVDLPPTIAFQGIDTPILPAETVSSHPPEILPIAHPSDEGLVEMVSASSREDPERVLERVVERREGSAAEVGAAQKAAMELVIEHIESGGASQSYEFAFRNPAVFFDSISAGQFDSLPADVRAEVRAAVEEGTALLQKEYGDLNAYYGGVTPTGFARTGRTLHRVQDLVRASRFLRIKRSELVPIARKLADAFEVAWDQAVDQQWSEAGRASYYAGNAKAATQMVGREVLPGHEASSDWAGRPLEEPAEDAPTREKAGYELESLRRTLEEIGPEHEIRVLESSLEDLRVIQGIFENAGRERRNAPAQRTADDLRAVVREFVRFNEDYREGYGAFDREVGNLVSRPVSEGGEAVAARLRTLEQQQADFMRLSRRLEEALSEVLLAKEEQLGYLGAGDSSVLATRTLDAVLELPRRFETQTALLEGVQRKLELLSSQDDVWDYDHGERDPIEPVDGGDGGGRG